MIYFLKHVDIEGPGTLGKFFQQKGFQTKDIDLYHGDALPTSFNDMDAVVILGGPMNVYEEATYPFLREETFFIRELFKRGIVTMGLCLGAQLIVKAFGAKVYKAPVKEIGIHALELTDSGLADPLFQGLSSGSLDFFQWHEDTFDLPAGAELLVQGRDCKHQVFRIGSRIYGFQCHMEIQREDAFLWLKNYCRETTSEYQQLKTIFSRQFDTYEERLYRTAQTIYNNLFHIITDTADVF